MISLYLCIVIILLMIAYAGIEGTLRVFVYLDLMLRYSLVRIKMYFMKKKLEKELMVFKNGDWKSFAEVREDDKQ